MVSTFSIIDLEFDVHHKLYVLTSLPNQYFSHVHKVHIHIQRKWPWDNSTSLEHNRLAIASGTPDCPARYSQWHTGLSGALAGALSELTALGFSERSSTKNHSTDRWDKEQRSTSPNGRLRDCVRSMQRQKSEHSLRRQVAPNCPVQQKDRWLQRSTAPNPNGRLMWHSPDNEQ
jgi:hypothetical protein